MATLTIADLDNGQRDLQTVDAVANSPADTTVTRFGDSVLTLAGALRRLGYKAPVPYASGLAVDNDLFTVSRDGVIYAPNPLLVPFTTGAWAANQWRPVQNTANTNQVYQFPTLGAAKSAASTLPAGSAVVVEGVSQGHATGGNYVASSGLPAVTVVDYPDLIAYSGKNTVVDVVGAMGAVRPSGKEGRFFIGPADPSETPDGGTVFRLSDGRIARRSYSGEVLTSWWGVDHAATQSAINAAYGKTSTVLINTHQTWTAPVTLKNGIKLRGLGVDVMGGGGTKVTYTGSTDALLLKNTVNGSTSANIDIEGIWFVAISLADNCGVIFDTASSVLKIRKCRFNAKNCIILDQTEISDIYDCSFAIGDGNKHCGVWIVNGPDKNPGAQPFWTNRISVKNCEFNGGPGSVFIWDDGGVNHVYKDNNYNGGGTHIIATAVNSLTISRGEYELNSGPAIIFSLSKRNGAAGSKCHAVIVSGAYYWAQIAVPFIASVAGAIGHLDVITNFINCPGTVFSGLNVACDSLRAQGNEQLGAGDGNTIINNYYDNVAAATAWLAATAAPVLGNGVLAATKSRKGREVTYRLLLQFGTTTTPGSGAWSFTLPHKANTQTAALTAGSAYALIIGTAGYALAASITSDGINMQIPVNNATPNAGAGVPAAWTSGSSLKAQITYEAANLI